MPGGGGCVNGPGVDETHTHSHCQECQNVSGLELGRNSGGKVEETVKSVTLVILPSHEERKKKVCVCVNILTSHIIKCIIQIG